MWSAVEGFQKVRSADSGTARRALDGWCSRPTQKRVSSRESTRTTASDSPENRPLTLSWRHGLDLRVLAPGANLPATTQEAR